MVRDALIRGLEDEEIRLDILGQYKQDMNLDEVLQYIEAKESGKCSAGRLLEGGTTANAATTSSYKRREKSKTQPCDGKSQACDYCGKTGHTRNKQDRIKNCTAYNDTYAKCGIPHHHESVRRQPWRRPQPATPKVQASYDDATAVFDALCSASDTSPPMDTNATTLDHYICN